MADRLEIILSADVSRFERGFGNSIRTASEFDAVIRRMTRGVFGYNEAGGAFVDSAGKQASALEVLNKLGVQSTKQLQQQIAALDDLSEGDSPPHARSNLLIATAFLLMARLTPVRREQPPKLTLKDCLLPTHPRAQGATPKNPHGFAGFPAGYSTK